MPHAETSTPALPAGPGRLRQLCGAAAVLTLCAIGLWAWSGGLPGPYHFDDYATPLGDPASQSLVAWQQYLPLTLRPVTKLSYALEAEAGLSAQPAPRRAVSLVVHAIAAALLLALIYRLTPDAGPWAAVFLAALWFIHPVHADAVLLLSGRTAALSGLFLLAALMALDRARRWLAALLFVLACLSRETALAGLLPLAVLAASRPESSFRSTLRDLAPALLGSVLVAVWILTTPRYLHLAEFSFLGRPFWHSLAAQVGAVPVGLGLLFKPSGLSIDYGIALPGKTSEPLFLLGVALYVAATTGMIVMLKRSRAAAVGLALWLAALLPTQSVIPKLDALTNRPLSLALAGLLLLGVPLLARFVHTLQARTRHVWRVADVAPFVRWLASGSAFVLCVWLFGATHHRAGLFRSELELWQDAAAKSDSNPRPHLQYASVLKDEGRNREAYQAIMAARRIDPFNSQVALFTRVYDLNEVLK